MPPVSPDRISLPDRYRVVRHLANGGMASVWEAHDELLDRDVAVKLLASHLGEDERARRRFQREARAAAGLSSHPNVVTIYDVGEHKHRVFMVMEIMRGGTLGDRLKRHEAIPHEQAVRWLGQAAAALDTAHHAGVVHRDIKPGNLLLDSRERLAVADFGIARLAWEDQLTATGQVLGTAAYLSPEQALGEAATAASDRYALAVVAYELLSRLAALRGRPLRRPGARPCRGPGAARLQPRGGRICQRPLTPCSNADWRRIPGIAGARPRSSSPRSSGRSRSRRARRSRRSRRGGWAGARRPRRRCRRPRTAARTRPTSTPRRRAVAVPHRPARRVAGTDARCATTAAGGGPARRC